jgi:hypothetical protein
MFEPDKGNIFSLLNIFILVDGFVAMSQTSFLMLMKSEASFMQLFNYGEIWLKHLCEN